MMDYVRTATIVCLTVLAAAACSGSSSTDVTVATAARGTIATDTGGLGTVAAGIDVPLALSFTDRVQGVSVGLGQHVSKGEDLLTIDPQPVVANLSNLQAHLQHAEADLAHVQALASGQRTATALRPGLQDQEQTLQSQAGLYNQLLATARGDGSTVTSPIDGEALAVNVRPSQVAKSGDTLVRVVDYRRITVTAELPVRAQPEVKVGGPARLTFAAVPGLTVTGTVTGVSPGAVNYGTGFQVTVDAPNTSDLRIHPGYQAYVQVPYTSWAGTIVRRAAVLNIGQYPSMFVAQGGVARLRRVQVGGGDGTSVQIVSGISPGEQYVLVGNENLADRDRIRVIRNLGSLGSGGSR